MRLNLIIFFVILFGLSSPIFGVQSFDYGLISVSESDELHKEKLTIPIKVIAKKKTKKLKEKLRRLRNWAIVITAAAPMSLVIGYLIYVNIAGLTGLTYIAFSAIFALGFSVAAFILWIVYIVRKDRLKRASEEEEPE